MPVARLFARPAVREEALSSAARALSERPCATPTGPAGVRSSAEQARRLRCGCAPRRCVKPSARGGMRSCAVAGGPGGRYRHCPVLSPDGALGDGGGLPRQFRRGGGGRSGGLLPTRANCVDHARRSARRVSCSLDKARAEGMRAESLSQAQRDHALSVIDRAMEHNRDFHRGRGPADARRPLPHPALLAIVVGTSGKLSAASKGPANDRRRTGHAQHPHHIGGRGPNAGLSLARQGGRKPRRRVPPALLR